MSTEPLLYFLKHSAVFIAVPAVLFFLLGFWAGRGKRVAAPLEKQDSAVEKTAAPALAMLPQEPVPSPTAEVQEPPASPGVEPPAAAPAAPEVVAPEGTPVAAEMAPALTPSEGAAMGSAASEETTLHAAPPEPVTAEAVLPQAPPVEATPEPQMPPESSQPAAETPSPAAEEPTAPEAPVSAAAPFTPISESTAQSPFLTEEPGPEVLTSPEGPLSAQPAPEETPVEAAESAPVQDIVLPPVEENIPLDLSVPELPAEAVVPVAGRLRTRRPARPVPEPAETEEDDRPFGFLLDDADDDARATKTALAALLAAADEKPTLATADSPTAQNG